MIFEVIATGPFAKNLKKLSKKYKSLKTDLPPLFELLSTNPTQQGVSLGNGCYKVRLAITSKNKGKSAGARIITYVKLTKARVYLLDICDKAEHGSITDKELKQLLSLISE